MHLLEHYAISSGVKIGKPFIYQKFFPVTANKYITLHTTSKPSKTYDYWKDAVAILSEDLDKAGIRIVQIGGKDDVVIQGAYNTCGQTNINQTAYLINNGMLHLGVDSFPTHIASGFGKKIVALYSNSRINNVGPYWTKDKDCILFEPDFSRVKPSYSFNENPKSINKIKPEEIARAVCKLLNIEFTFKYQTIYIGRKYNENYIESVPNQIVNVNQQNKEVVIRMDYLHDEKMMLEQVKKTKCCILLDKPINLEKIAPYKDNVRVIQYEITKYNNPSFVKRLSRGAFSYSLISYLPEEELKKEKLRYMDYGIIFRREIASPHSVPEFEGVDLSEVYYKSQKNLLSNNKIYYGGQAFKDYMPVSKESPLIKVVDKPSFWKEIDNYYFFKKI